MLNQTAPELVQHGRPPIDVVLLGADPTGTNDSTGAFVKAIDQAKNNGAGVVMISDGVFRHTGFRLSSGVHLVGAGSGRRGQGGKTILKQVGGGIGIQGDGGPVISSSIRYLGLQGSDGDGGIGLLLDSFQYFELEDVLIDAFRNSVHTGIGLRMINNYGVCAYNNTYSLKIENSDKAIDIDSVNGSHSAGYNTFTNTVIYQERDCVSLKDTAGNGGSYSIFDGLYVQGNLGVGTYIYIEGNNNRLVGINLDQPGAGTHLQLGKTTTQGNTIHFLGGFDPAKFVTAQTSGAANDIRWPGSLTHSPRKPFRIEDFEQQAIISLQSFGTRGSEIYLGSGTNGEQNWKVAVEDLTITPYLQIAKSGVGGIQRWRDTVIEMLKNLQLSNNLLMPNASGIYFATTTDVLENILGVTNLNNTQLRSALEGGGLQLIGQHAVSGTILLRPCGEVDAALFDGSVAAGTTRMQIYDADLAALKRVKSVAVGSLPVGAKVLYIEP